MMNKYLTIFGSHSQYVEPEVKPNVSYCIQEDEIHYNPIETRLVAKYNVTNTNQPIKLYNYNESITADLMFDNVEIDGVIISISDLDTAQGNYQFSVGEHTVKYTLKDPTSIANSAFSNCTGLTSVTIPNSVMSIGNGAFWECDGLISVTIGNFVTSIGQYVFYDCDSLTSIIIPNSVTTIGTQAFAYCSSLTSVTIGNSVTGIGVNAFQRCSALINILSLATIAPTITNETFNSVSTNGTLTVPNGSSGYNVWMGTGDYYLGKYNWTKVEQ